LANHLRDTFGCDLVALAVQKRGQTRLVSVSGWNPNAEGQTAGRAVLQASIAQVLRQSQPCMVGPASDAEDATIQSLREWFDPAHGLIAPLEEPDGTKRGGWIFLWKKPLQDAGRVEALINAAGPEVAAFLPLLRAAKPGQTRGALIRLWRRATANQKRFATIAAGLAALVMVTPAPLPVETTCELEPVLRRVVAAPFDGILERSLVKTGETVKAGQVLAELDGREIRWKLADAVAQRAKALAEADLTLAAGKIAEARMAALEAESLEQEIAVLTYRSHHLAVKAPIDGIVLRGDLERSEGAPLRLGDALFEIGPLDQLLVQMSTNPTDVALLREGAPVEISLESFPGETFHGRVNRIAPRSEARDGQNIILCETELPNPDEILRPGLKGKARLQGPRRPLLWRWLRAPWMAIRQATW
jgi:RND family efflux transporter MFP subunit